MAQRISRARQSIEASGVPFRMPPDAREQAERLGAVLQSSGGIPEPHMRAARLAHQG